MKRQAAQPAQDQRTGLAPSAASLRTDLELARAQTRDLRAERDKLREHLRLQLGHQLDQIRAKTLTERIDELTVHNQRLADQHSQAQAENQQFRRRITELEDDLAAARTSLRRMIRAARISRLPSASTPLRDQGYERGGC
jgi:predicted nuclease with TOPRIM domain